MAALRPGECRHRVTFDEPVTSRNAIGEEVITWTPAFTVWGSVAPLRGRELILAEQVAAQMDTRIRLFWSTQTDRITAKWQARHAGVTYGIAAPPIHVDFARREVEIMATHIETAGA